MKRYEDWKSGSEPFFPNHLLKEAFIVLLMIAIFAIAVVAIPELSALLGAGKESAAMSAAKPQWFFLPLYALANLLPGATGFVVAIIAGAIILLWPLLDRKPRATPLKRPALLICSIIFALSVIALGIAELVR